ncbi:serpin family protein [Demequina sp.]|uniref:serpin family protein n=1 Tax=Demequina sp. TaxID=2050685 RepID=UPI003D09CC23
MRRSLPFLATALVLTGCAAAYADPVVDRPITDQENVPALVDGINDAGLQIYLAARKDGANTAVSPVSIGLAFGMADAGATGDLERALSDFFGFPASGDERLEAFNALDLALGSDQEGKILTIANRLFTDEAFTPNEDYRVTLATYFGAGAEPIPMVKNPDAAAKRVNGWISDETTGLIKDLVKPNTFNDRSRVMLANTVYMKADWDEPFEKDATSDGDFTHLDGSTSTVPLMHQTVWGEAAVGDGWAAGVKPYLEGDTEMLIIVPDQGRFDEVDSTLPEVLATINAHLEGTEFALTLPKFTVESSTDLREAMETTLGVKGIYDVIGLDGIGPNLYISSASHGVKVIVDEKGTEAAAATVVGMDAGSAPMQPPIEVKADKPFIYVIRDTQTGAIEFVGRVLDPDGP